MEHIEPPASRSGLIQIAYRLSRGLLEKALVAYFAAIDDETPGWAKATLASALGYLVLPADAVPDVLPAVGYADDSATLVAALATVGVHVRDRHGNKARRVLRRWGI